MISVLDLLKYRLGQGGVNGGMSGFGQFEGEPALDELMRSGRPVPPPPPLLPPGLPDAVRRSIQGQPSYDEGQIMAPRPYYNPSFETETMLPLDSPQRRENRLNDKVGFGQYLRREGMFAVPEGGWLSHGDRGFAEPFSSPLNQMLRRGPFALY